MISYSLNQWLRRRVRRRRWPFPRGGEVERDDDVPVAGGRGCLPASSAARSAPATAPRRAGRRPACGGHRQHADVALAAAIMPAALTVAATVIGIVRAPVGLELDLGVVQLDPVASRGHRLVLGEQADDDAEALVHLLALARGLDAEEARVAGSAPGPTPSMARPCVRWSIRTMRSATWNGWW